MQLYKLGTVAGQDVTGAGFIGDAFDGTQMTVTFNNSSNTGIISGEGPLGGFVGSASDISNLEVTFTNGFNDGVVRGTWRKIGGFIGSFHPLTKSTLSFLNCSNKKEISGYHFNVGGLIGNLAPSQTEETTLLIKNCANTGKIQASEYLGCGFFCTEQPDSFNLNATVLNSINKETVYGRDSSFGIANIITKARNVVSIGSVNGNGNDRYSFWNVSTSAELFYGLKYCKHCDNASIIEVNQSSMLYQLLDSEDFVHDLLNEEAINQGYGMLWTDQLELVDNLMLSVSVIGLFNHSFIVDAGTQLNQVGNLSEYFNERFNLVDEKNNTCDPMKLVSRNMTLVLGGWINITVGHPVLKNETMYVTFGFTLDFISEVFDFIPDKFIVVSKTTNERLNKLSLIKETVVIALCYEIKVEGVFDSTFIAESGTLLGQTGNLSSYFGNEMYVIVSSDETGLVQNSTDQVTTNLTITIIKKPRVSVGSPYNRDVYVFPGETLEDMEQEFNIPMDDFTVLDRATKEPLNKMTVIEKDTELMLCHVLRTFGELKESFLIEHNTTLLTIPEMTKFLNSSFIIFDAQNTSAVFMNDTKIFNKKVLIIRRASKQDLLLEFEEKDIIDEDAVKEALKDMVGSRNGDQMWIDVSSREDGSFFVSVILIEEESFDVADSLRECSR